MYPIPLFLSPHWLTLLILIALNPYLSPTSLNQSPCSEFWKIRYHFQCSFFQVFSGFFSLILSKIYRALFDNRKLATKISYLLSHDIFVNSTNKELFTKFCVEVIVFHDAVKLQSFVFNVSDAILRNERSISVLVIFSILSLTL